MDMQSLAEAIADQVNATQQALSTMERDEVLRVWLAAGRMLADLRLLRDEVEKRALDLIPRDERVVLDGAVFSRGWRSGTRNGWDHEALTRRVFAALDLPDASSDILTRFLQIAHVDYWRPKELQALGIDADEYVQTKPGHAKLEAIE
jgi:hypothetical protein